MTRIISVVGQKGGIGKTSMVQNLSSELAAQNKRVLTVDFDPQSNLTMGWGQEPDRVPATIYDCLNNTSITTDAILKIRPNLDLLPANLDLSAAEMAFVTAMDRNFRLKKALAPVAERYHFIIIDAPPSLGFFTVNAMVAATELLIPLQVHPYAYRALDQLLAIVEQVLEINPTLQPNGIALTMHDRRNSLTAAIEDAARDRFGALVYDTVIPVNVRIPEATLEGVSVGEYEISSAGATAYKSLAKEVMNRG